MRFLSRRRSASVAPVRSAVRSARSIAALHRATQIESLEDRKLLAAQLVVSAAAAPQPNVNAGADITYSVAVRNVGTDPANNVQITFDPDDANVPPAERSAFRSIVQLSGPGFTLLNPGVNNQGNVTGTLGTLNAGLAATFTIVYRVDAATPELAVINGVFSAVSTETPVAVTEDDSVIVSTRADLQVTKTKLSPVGNPVAGLDVTYEIVVVNNGPSTANNVVLTDIVPANTTFVSAAQTAGPVFTVNSTPTVGSAGTYQVSIAGLGSAQSATFQITLHLDSAVTGTLFNTASATTTTFDPTLANNLSTIGGPILVQSDVSIVSTTNKATTTFEGTFFTYTVTIFNRGPSDATGVAFAWDTPTTGKAGAREQVYYGPTPITLVSGPAFNINLPADPPRRGTITGAPAAAGVLQAGVGTTYTFQMGTSEDNDLVQISSVTSGSPDTDPSNNTWTDNLHVADAPLVLQEAPPIQGNDGQPIDAEVMIFTDTNSWPGNSQVGAYTTPGGRLGEMLAGDFVATVNWGDGTPPSTGVVTLDVTGTYHVAARHTYSTPGIFTVTTTVTSDGEAVVVGTSTATVGVPPRGGAGVGNLKFTENVSETKKIGTFFPGTATGATFTGTINWGDGTGTSAATLTQNGFSYDVIGTHNYVDEGTYTATVTITGSDSIVNTFQVQIVVDDRAVVGTAVTINGQTGIQIVNATAATFTDPGGSKAASAYTATINWGDGTAVEPISVVYNSGTDSFSVVGTHTYLTAGSYNTVITISHGTAPDTVFNGLAIITDGPVNPAVQATAVNVNATANIAFTGPVATFTDNNPTPDVVGNYVAIINWGDGTPTTNGVITFNPGTGVFTVTGTHTWATAGTFNMIVTIRHGNSPDAIVNPVATVSNNSQVNGTTPVSFNGVEGQTLTNVIVGRFTSNNTAAVPADFVAVIDWGDGSATSAGTIVSTGPGAFNVTGTHQYTDDGTYPVTVTVTPAAGGASSVINSTGVIRDAALRGISRLFGATRNVPFNGLVASFVDNNPFDITPSDYLVTIDWGDGTATTGGTITYDSTLKQFNVAGSHTYTTASPLGGFKLTITVRDGLSQVAITSTATVP